MNQGPLVTVKQETQYMLPAVSPTVDMSSSCIDNKLIPWNIYKYIVYIYVYICIYIAIHRKMQTSYFRDGIEEVFPIVSDVSFWVLLYSMTVLVLQGGAPVR